jgi:hypothetical protein
VSAQQARGRLSEFASAKLMLFQILCNTLKWGFIAESKRTKIEVAEKKRRMKK